MAVVSLWSSEPGRLESTSRWGVWPIAIVLVVIAAARIGAIVFHDAPPRMRALFGSVAAFAAIILSVRILGAFGALGQDSLFTLLLIATVALSLTRRDRTLGISWRRLASLETLPIVAVSLGAIAIAALAADWLPIWQWDALGYHLPYVNFALQHGTLADVPPNVPYISTYPHGMELFFVAWRAMLTDDRLVDAAQIPLGLLGAGAIACLSRELGAKSEHGIAAGLVWLTLPAVFLQLPTNYVDVGSAALLLCAAAFIFADPHPRNVVGAGVALGAFLASKPSAPVGAALALAALVWRTRSTWRADHADHARVRVALFASIALVLVLGAESYIANILRYENPIWPVKLSLGPIELPGETTMQTLLDTGPEAPRLHGPLPVRLVRSWLSIDAPPMFDMRYGGLGIAFLVALPAALVIAYRRRDLALVLVALAALASPDPVFPRYILAFPGIVLALAAVLVTHAPRNARRVGLVAVAAASLHGLVGAYPGLTGEGPPLLAYARMSESERLRAVGADGRPTKFYDALDRLGPQDMTAFDASLHLPYLAWPPDLSHPATRIPDDVDRTTAERIVSDPHLRLLIVDRASPVAAAARARTNVFIELFQCRSSTCVVLFRS